MSPIEKKGSENENIKCFLKGRADPSVSPVLSTVFVCNSAGAECVDWIRSRETQPDKDNCDALRVGRNKQQQRNGVRSQRSEQQ